MMKSLFMLTMIVINSNAQGWPPGNSLVPLRAKAHIEIQKKDDTEGLAPIQMAQLMVQGLNGKRIGGS